MANPSCAFCPTTGDLAACTWPVRKFVQILGEQLVAGDIIRGSEDRTAEILSISRHAPTRSLLIRYRLTTSRTKAWHFSSFFDSPMWAMRDATCEALGCELHRAERGEVTIACADHWRPLEVAA